MESKQKKTVVLLGMAIGLSVLASCGAVAAACVALLATNDSYAVEGDGGDRALLETFGEFSFDTLDDWPGAQAIAEGWQIEWPDSARDIRLAEDGFQDPYYNVRMTVDSGDIDGLVASPACQGLMEQVNSAPRDAFTTTPIEWWTPETATTFAQCNGPVPSTRSIHTFLDQSDPKETIVYVLVVLS